MPILQISVFLVGTFCKREHQQGNITLFSMENKNAELFKAASNSMHCQYGHVGTQSDKLCVPIVVEHCCPTGLVSPEYIILINYTRYPLNLNDLQESAPSRGHVASCAGPDFYKAS